MLAKPYSLLEPTGNIRILITEGIHAISRPNVAILYLFKTISV